VNNSTQANRFNWSSSAFIVGRLLVGGFYVYAGTDNLLNISSKVGYATFKGVPFPMLSITLASILILIGGMSILTGFRPIVGIYAVILFLVPVTLMMHKFWVVEDLQLRVIEWRAFLSNLALAGSALLLTGVPRPWTWSVESLSNKAKSASESWKLSPSAK
jgi:uncharacterized membrane protein YphA (DoxX/SURF4 family)